MGDGYIVNALEIVVRFNERVILDHACLTIGDSDHLGLVGRNGSGKSTFLKVLTGELTPDTGQVLRAKDLIVGCLPQDFALNPALTVYENVRSGAQWILDLVREFESLPPDSKQHDALEERIHFLDGWNLENRIQTAMSHLKVPDGGLPIHSLSGGEQRRIALCRAIISHPDLLILDEPTNHLDPESIEWAVEFLQRYRQAFILVTHDRHFLDQVTSDIVELDGGVFTRYTGNYSDYLEASATRQAIAEVNEQKRQGFLRRELEWVRRGPQARTTKSKSRLDSFYEVASQAPPEPVLEVDMLIPPPPPLASRVVELINAGLKFGDRPIISNLSFRFEAGSRIGVAGPNGSGKTTLLKLILGQLAPTEGSLKVGTLTQFNYVDQGRCQLNEENTVLQEIADGSEFVIFGDGRISLRSYLKRFLFSDERISSKVKHLSGGERSRLLLARILKNGGNFLVMDEPTNDLDLPTLRVLEETLLAFSGCVLVVSHDRYFLNRVCTGLLVFEGGGRVVHSVGDYDYYLEKKARAAAAQPAPEIRKPAAAKKNAGPAPAKTSRPRKLTWNEARELEKIEPLIEAEEATVARLEALFSSPDFHQQQNGPHTAALVAEMDAARQALDRLYARWAELENIKNGQ